MAGIRGSTARPNVERVPNVPEAAVLIKKFRSDEAELWVSNGTRRLAVDAIDSDIDESVSDKKRGEGRGAAPGAGSNFLSALASLLSSRVTRAPPHDSGATAENGDTGKPSWGGLPLPRVGANAFEFCCLAVD